MSEIILDAQAVVVGYDDRRPPVIHGQDLAVTAGQITALVGPNGSGKSTLLKALAGHLKPAGGQVILDGKAIATCSPREIAQRLGILFQDNSAPAGITVEALAMYGRHPHRGMFESLTAEDEAAVERALALTGAAPLRRRRLDQLSGGQRQLAWLALALAQAPRVLLLDEPTTYLDMRHQIELMQVISALRDEGEVTVVMVLHDINHAARYADEVVALKAGRVVARGPAVEVVRPALLRAVFEIEAEVVTASDGSPICVPLAVHRAEED